MTTLSIVLIAVSPKPQKKPVNRLCAKSSYQNLSRQPKRALKRHCDDPEFLEIDNRVHEFVVNPEVNQVDIVLDSPFERFLLHSICQFYYLESFSRNSKKGRRVVTCKKRKNLTEYPTVQLSTYLISEFRSNDSSSEEDSLESEEDEFLEL